ncbi:hypothetical protein ACFL6U_32185 [Planctomycetota bacterium]
MKKKKISVCRKSRLVIIDRSNYHSLMTQRRKYLLCPQCGSRRILIQELGGKDHYVYVLQDYTYVYAKTGELLPDDIDTSQLRCADCSWKGTHRKLVKYFTS